MTEKEEHIYTSDDIGEKCRECGIGTIKDENEGAPCLCFIDAPCGKCTTLETFCSHCEFEYSNDA